ncbi:hypothetical protein HanRHA438_Chr10g0443971 [Helianthus annuus]|nr:hypothetical protein HanRHA438_Chr10g0443971 [Helianthus annuus]
MYSDLTKKSNWVWHKGHNMQNFGTLSTELVNFCAKGHPLQFDVNINDKTCNLLLKICIFITKKCFLNK